MAAAIARAEQRWPHLSDGRVDQPSAAVASDGPVETVAGAVGGIASPRGRAVGWAGRLRARGAREAAPHTAPPQAVCNGRIQMVALRRGG